MVVSYHPPRGYLRLVTEEDGAEVEGGRNPKTCLQSTCKRYC